MGWPVMKASRGAAMPHDLPQDRMSLWPVADISMLDL